MQGPGARGRTHLPAAALCLLLGASGCYAVPPPLMYPGTPVPAGHLGFGGAVAGSIMPGAYDTPPRLFVAPGLELSGRYGVAPGVSLGLRVLGGGGAMIDVRFEVLHTPHLSLSVGLEPRGGAGGHLLRGAAGRHSASTTSATGRRSSAWARCRWSSGGAWGGPRSSSASGPAPACPSSPT